MSLTSPQRELLTSACDLAIQQPGEDSSLAMLPLPGSAWPPARRRKVADELRDEGLLTMASPWVRVSPAGWQTLRRTPPQPATEAPDASPTVQTSREQVLAALTAGEWRSVPELTVATGLTCHVIGPVASALVRKGEIECQDPTPKNGMRRRYRLASGTVVPSAPPEPAPPEAPARHATSEAARQVLWDLLQPGEERSGLTVLGLAKMAAEELEGRRCVAAQVVAWLDEQGVPPGTLMERLACCCKAPPSRPETQAAFADEALYGMLESQGLTIAGAVRRLAEDVSHAPGESPCASTTGVVDRVRSLASDMADLKAEAASVRQVLARALGADPSGDCAAGWAARAAMEITLSAMVLDAAGAPANTADGRISLEDRIRWLHGELVAASPRPGRDTEAPSEDHYAEQLWEALGSGPLEGLGWDQLLDVVRDRSRPLHLQLDDEIVRHRGALRTLEAAQSVLAGGEA